MVIGDVVWAIRHSHCPSDWFVHRSKPEHRRKRMIHRRGACPISWSRHKSARKTSNRCRSPLRRFPPNGFRSEEHTSELQSLMRISYAVLCLKKKKKQHYKE